MFWTKERLARWRDLSAIFAPLVIALASGVITAIWQHGVTERQERQRRFELAIAVLQSPAGGTEQSAELRAWASREFAEQAGVKQSARVVEGLLEQPEIFRGFAYRQLPYPIEQQVQEALREFERRSREPPPDQQQR